MIVLGSAAFVVKEKLQSLKFPLRKWNKDRYGWEGLEVEDAIKIINVCDDRFREVGSSARGPGVLAMEDEGIVIAKERERAVRNFWSNLQRRECMIKQKSRMKWCREGDLNTRFFHHAVKARARDNYIGSVASSSGRVSEVESVKEEVNRFFEAKFKESPLERPRLENLIFNN